MPLNLWNCKAIFIFLSRWMLSCLATVFLVPVLVSPKFRILFHCNLSGFFINNWIPFLSFHLIFPITKLHCIFFILGIQEWNLDMSQNCPRIWECLLNYRSQLFFHLWLIFNIIWPFPPLSRIVITCELSLQYLSSKSFSSFPSQFLLLSFWLRDFFPPVSQNK